MGPRPEPAAASSPEPGLAEQRAGPRAKRAAASPAARPARDAKRRVPTSSRGASGAAAMHEGAPPAPVLVRALCRSAGLPLCLCFAWLMSMFTRYSRAT